jgi:hypothetical protein
MQNVRRDKQTAEQTWRMPRDELDRKNQEVEHEFIETGPPELRPLRQEVMSHRERFRDIVMNRSHAYLALQRAQAQSDVPSDDIAALQKNYEVAEQAVQESMEEGRAIGERLQEESMLLESRTYPRQHREKALDLIREREQALREIYSQVDAGLYGSIGGSIFRTLRHIGEAQLRGDADALRNLKTELKDLKKQERAMEKLRTDIDKQVKKTRESYSKRLKKLLP